MWLLLSVLASAETLAVPTVEWSIETCDVVGHMRVIEVDPVRQVVAFDGVWHKAAPLPPEVFLDGARRDARLEVPLSPLYEVRAGEDVVAGFSLSETADGTPQLRICHVFLHAVRPTALARQEISARGVRLTTTEQILATVEDWVGRPEQLPIRAPVVLTHLDGLPSAPEVDVYLLPPLDEHLPMLRQMALSDDRVASLRAVEALSNRIYWRKATDVFDTLLARDPAEAVGSEGRRDTLREAVLLAMRAHNLEPDHWTSVECAYEPWWDARWVEGG